ncbi:MAG: NUDIX domain-containing protein [Leptolyngbya sp. SIO3F4]|nr:NUDIX domain-containing protein [Leptolyngbya sp. SIO3F4]
MGKPRIRPIALGLIRYEGHIFVSKGYDKSKKVGFYRFLGGGIDFGETSVDALRREFKEEIQAELSNIEYLTCLDNIFTCNGIPGHELIQLFLCDFVDWDFYHLDRVYDLIEGQETKEALWISTDRVLSGELNLVPSNCHPYI